MIKASKRIQALANNIPNCKTFADIGTDHGYLPYLLLESQTIENAILCDINSEPLNNARSTFTGVNYDTNVEFRLGSGLVPVSVGEVECVCISGMGGGLIQSILSDDIHKTQSIGFMLLQPQTEQAELREWVIKNNFKIHYDFYIEEDGKYYEMFLVSTALEDISYQNRKVPCDDLEFGYAIKPSNLDEYKTFLVYKRQKYSKIYESIEKIDAMVNKKELTLSKLKTIDFLLNWLME